MKKESIFFLAMQIMAPLYGSGSVQVPTILELQTDLDTIIAEIAELQKWLAPNGSIIPYVPPVILSPQQVLEQHMMALIAPLYGSLVRTNGTTSQDVDLLITQSTVNAYQAYFREYVTRYGDQTPSYRTLAFGNLFLPLFVTKNVFRDALLALHISSNTEISAAIITPALLKDATAFEAVYAPFIAFVNSLPTTYVPPVPVSSVLPGYAAFNSYAITIITVSKITPPPVPVIGSANEYIKQSFNDATLSALPSIQAVQASLTAFQKLYTTSDQYYPVYQLWAGYVPVRYRELQFLNNQTAANANLFMGAVRSFSALGSGLIEPYKTQYNDLMLEFNVVYQLARITKIEQA